MPGVQPHRHGAARPHAIDAAGCPLDVRRIDVAARHDDYVLEPTAHHDLARLGEVTEIARVVPTVVILRRNESRRSGVPQRHRLTAHLDDTDAARRQHGAVDVDDASLEPLQQTAE